MIKTDIEFFNAEKSLIGLDYELLNMVEKLDKDKKPIVEQYHVFSIGLCFITIRFTLKRGS